MKKQKSLPQFFSIIIEACRKTACAFRKLFTVAEKARQEGSIGPGMTGKISTGPSNNGDNEHPNAPNISFSEQNTQPFHAEEVSNDTACWTVFMKSNVHIRSTTQLMEIPPGTVKILELYNSINNNFSNAQS